MADRWEGPRTLRMKAHKDRERPPDRPQRVYVCRCGLTIKRDVQREQAGVESFTCKRCTRRKQPC